VKDWGKLRTKKRVLTLGEKKKKKNKTSKSKKGGPLEHWQPQRGWAIFPQEDLLEGEFQSNGLLKKGSLQRGGRWGVKYQII